MNSEIMKNNPNFNIEELNDDEMEVIIDSLIQEITADINDHTLDINHPLWQRVKDAYKWLAPTKTDDDLKQTLQQTFDDDGQYPNDLQEVMIKGLGLDKPSSNEEHDNEK